MVVCSNRPIAWGFYKNVIALRPEWNKSMVAEPEVELSEKDKREIKPMEKIKMVMTRGKDDPEELHELQDLSLPATAWH